MAEDGERTHYAPLDTVIGRVLIAYRGHSVRGVGFGEGEGAFRAAQAARDGEPPVGEARVPAGIADAVRAHVEGEREFPIAAVDLTGVSAFQRRVLAAAAAIPYGEVRTYRQIAAAAHAPGAARAVGTALARNPVPVLIPCHRVVRADGRLGEYTGGGPATKRRLLRHEGVELGSEPRC